MPARHQRAAAAVMPGPSTSPPWSDVAQLCSLLVPPDAGQEAADREGRRRPPGREDKVRVHERQLQWQSLASASSGQQLRRICTPPQSLATLLPCYPPLVTPLSSAPVLSHPRVSPRARPAGSSGGRLRCSSAFSSNIANICHSLLKCQPQQACVWAARCCLAISIGMPCVVVLPCCFIGADPRPFLVLFCDVVGLNLKLWEIVGKCRRQDNRLQRRWRWFLLLISITPATTAGAAAASCSSPILLRTASPCGKACSTS